MQDNSQWETGICPICKDPPLRPRQGALYTFQLREVPVLTKDCGGLAPKGLSIIPCKRCGLFYLSPRLKEDAIKMLYEAPEYFKGGTHQGYDDYSEQARTLEMTFRWFLKRLHSKGLTGGALLDVGCGPGLFLKEARAYFHRRVGTDLCDEVAGLAAKNSDVALCGGPLSARAYGPFDTITAIGVLEHVYDAVPFIRDCASLLRPGGHIIIVTPDIMGFWRKIMGKRWPSFKLPEHIAYYQRDTIKTLAKEANMKVKDFFPYHQAFPLGLILRRLGLAKNNIKPLKDVAIPLPCVMMTAVLCREA